MLAWLRKLFKKKETPLKKYIREHPLPEGYNAWGRRYTPTKSPKWINKL